MRRFRLLAFLAVAPAAAACEAIIDAPPVPTRADGSLVDASEDASATDAGTLDATTVDGSVSDATVSDASSSDARSFDAQSDGGGTDASPRICGALQYLCGAVCVDAGPTHCGSCTEDCTALSHVVPGAVSCTIDALDLDASSCDLTHACAPGYAHCAGDASTTGCETNLGVNGNCGACGVTCDGGTVCGGLDGGGFGCVASCGSLTNCSGTCTNLATDPTNCGACDRACPVPANAQAICVPDGGSYSCSFECDSNSVLCGNGTECATFVAPTGPLLYVSFSGGNDTTGTGSIGAPYKSLARALGSPTATGGGATIYMAPGTYAETAGLSIPAKGVRIVGGLTTTFAPSCVGDASAPLFDRTLVTLAPANTSTNVGFAAITTNGGTSSIESLTVENLAVQAVTASGAPEPGQTLYGVFATSGSLVLDNLVIVVGDAGGGSTGTNGSSAPASCDAGGDGAAGLPGPNGYGGTGSFSSSGFVPGIGTAGTPGFQGSNMTGASVCVTNPSLCQLYQPPGGIPPVCEQKGGTIPTQCGTQGSNGCGGYGGAPGGPGAGGGSSIGVFSASATVTIENCLIRTGNGGTGGNGSAGYGGGYGSYGTVPGSMTSESCQGDASSCGLVGTTVTAPAAFGGSGGAGGAGGGGGGGDSYGVYMLSAGGISIVDLDAGRTVITVGDAGAGGGTVPGSAGTAAPVGGP